MDRESVKRWGKRCQGDTYKECYQQEGIGSNGVREGWVGRAGSERLRAGRTVGCRVKGARDDEKKRNGVRAEQNKYKRAVRQMEFKSRNRGIMG